MAKVENEGMEFDISDEEILNDYRVVFVKQDNDGSLYSIPTTRLVRIIEEAVLKGLREVL